MRFYVYKEATAKHSLKTPALIPDWTFKLPSTVRECTLSPLMHDTETMNKVYFRAFPIMSQTVFVFEVLPSFLHPLLFFSQLLVEPKVTEGLPALLVFYQHKQPPTWGSAAICCTRDPAPAGGVHPPIILLL